MSAMPWSAWPRWMRPGDAGEGGAEYIRRLQDEGWLRRVKHLGISFFTWPDGRAGWFINLSLRFGVFEARFEALPRP